MILEFVNLFNSRVNSEIDFRTMRRYFGAFLLVFFFCHDRFCYSEKAPYTFVKEAVSAPEVTHHEYIIIGGGTAGCPLAATLSQNASVLVLERGGSPYGNPKITDRRSFFLNLLHNSPKSPLQQFISEDGVINHRARILGGGSAVNAGFYTRAGANYIEGAGWDPKLVDESYQWAEKVVAFEPEVVDWQSALKDGLVEAGVGPDNGFTYAELVGTNVGGTAFDKEGIRHSAADFLEEAHPAMIEVFLHATVQKILFKHSTHENAKPKAYGVIYKDGKGVEHKALLSKHFKSEIILSAGGLGSPQLLMLSGVGPAQHLRSHGIDVVLDQPLVGQGMADNPMTLLIVPSPVPVDVSLVQVVGFTKGGSYIEGLSGINLIPSISDEQIINQSYTKAEEGSSNTDHTTIKAGIIFQKVEGPLSSGHLELKNTNPDLNPSVTFNYFKERADLDKCIEGMKTLINVVESKAFSKFRSQDTSVQSLMNMVARAPGNLRPRHVNTALSLDQYCIDTVMTMWHFHGGCQVGGVVDKDYKVLGVDDVRVIDSSTFRGNPGANPQATIMMLGRYVGLMILKSRLDG